MFTACWSVKGGSGVSVVAAALAVRYASEFGSSLLVDLGGDQPDIAGLSPSDHRGLLDWVSEAHAGEALPIQALQVDLGGGVALLPWGTHPASVTPMADVLLAALAGETRPVVIDCGTPVSCSSGPRGELALALASAATQSLLVTRPCLLALKRAVHAPLRPSGVVVLAEAGRALRSEDVSEVLGVPVVAEVAVDPAVARAVDAGLLLQRMPRPLSRGLRHVA